MNSTIKQFAELSKSYKTILVDGQMQSVLLIDPERFAQMIVQECANIFDKDEMELTLTKRTIHNMIKEHFGIE